MKEILTHTKRRDFQNCNRYYFWRHEALLQPKITAAPRRRGHAFGAAIFDVIQQDKWDSVDGIARKAVAEAYSDVHPNDQADADAMEFEMHAIPLLVIQYFDRYGIAKRREIEYVQPLINPATGHRSRKFDRGGKIDGWEIDSKGRLVIIEDKLVSQITQTTIRKLELDAQVSEYVDALTDYLSGEVLVSFRHTRWPSIRQRQGETISQFCERFGADLVEREDWYYNEQTVFFSGRVLDEFRAGRWRVAQQILQNRRASNQLPYDRQQMAWPKNTARCTDFGVCPYMALCLGEPDAISLYEIVKDNPELEGTYAATEE